MHSFNVAMLKQAKEHIVVAEQRICSDYTEINTCKAWAGQLFQSPNTSGRVCAYVYLPTGH